MYDMYVCMISVHVMCVCVVRMLLTFVCIDVCVYVMKCNVCSIMLPMYLMYVCGLSALVVLCLCIMYVRYGCKMGLYVWYVCMLCMYVMYVCLVCFCCLYVYMYYAMYL